MNTNEVITVALVAAVTMLLHIVMDRKSEQLVGCYAMIRVQCAFECFVFFATERLHVDTSYKSGPLPSLQLIQVLFV